MDNENPRASNAKEITSKNMRKNLNKKTESEYKLRPDSVWRAVRDSNP